MTEELNVAGVGLGVVGTDEAEECALARPVGAAKSPALPFVDSPGERLENDVFSISDADVLEVQNILSVSGIEIGGRRMTDGQAGYPLPDLFAQLGQGDCRVVLTVLGECHLGQEMQVLDWQDVCDEVGNIVALAEYEDDLQLCFASERFEQKTEVVACRSIESNEGVVQDEHYGVRPEHLSHLELSQLSAAKRDDVLRGEPVELEHLGQLLAQSLPLFQLLLPFFRQEVLSQPCIGILIEALQKLPCSRSILCDVVLIPALLIIIGIVLVAIGIAEGDVLQVLADESEFARREVILNFVEEQGIMTRQYLYEPRLPCSIVAHDSYLLTSEYLQVDGFCHPPKRMPGNAVLYLYH